MQVFYTNFSDYQSLPECPLSQYRRKKISRITNKDVFRKEIITEFFLLKCLLSIDPDISRPLNILTKEYGKPYIPNSNIFFSLSHSDDLLVVVIDDREVGIDCESSNANHNYLEIAKRFFSEQEYLTIHDYNDFLKVWTKKEAYAKMLGVPVSSILNKDLSNISNITHLVKDSYHITICRS